MINLNDPFGVCFSMMKIKYMEYDESITQKNFLEPTDKVNIFINLESVFKNLSTMLGLEERIISQKDFDDLMVSHTINLAGHYYRFFRLNGLDTRIYIYNTDFSSNNFNQRKYNTDYRAYYLIKYNDNPKFTLLTERLHDKILPTVKILCDFIPNIYYISSNNIEGSLTPYIISQNDTSRKNFIITNDIFDTQYSFIDGFVNHCINRGKGFSSICSTLMDYIKFYLKPKDDDIVEYVKDVISSYSAYCSLISVIGNKPRSIERLMGYGCKTFIKNFSNGIVNNIITKETKSPEMIGDIFNDDDTKKEFINNYYCTNVLYMYDELTLSEKDSIMSQIVDRVDINSLKKINSTRFYNYPLTLESLLC